MSSCKRTFQLPLSDASRNRFAAPVQLIVIGQAAIATRDAADSQAGHGNFTRCGDMGAVIDGAGVS